MTTIREGRGTITVFSGDLEWRQGLDPHVQNLCGRCIWNALTYKEVVVVIKVIAVVVIVVVVVALVEVVIIAIIVI